MPKPVVIVLGAGASHDCASPSVEPDNLFKPPLVTELFDTRHTFRNILKKYPRAQAAAPSIRQSISDGSISLEKFLREQLYLSKNPEVKKLYEQIPLYLQELLFAASRQYSSDADNYDQLIYHSLHAKEALFITLNYDLLLDDRLAIHRPINTLEDYLGEKWSLYKLHGSINWAKKILNKHETVPNSCHRRG